VNNHTDKVHVELQPPQTGGGEAVSTLFHIYIGKR
jgi:hypothetical protein